jgi:hypothetical protein
MKGRRTVAAQVLSTFPAVSQENAHDSAAITSFEAFARHRPPNRSKLRERGPALGPPPLHCRCSSHHGATVARVARFKPITDDDVLNAIIELAGDGYCLAADVLPRLPSRFSHADRRRALHRSVNRGLVIERRGPDGREHVAVASEGWRRLRARAA